MADDDPDPASPPIPELGGEWQLDAEPEVVAEPDEDLMPPSAPPPPAPPPPTPRPRFGQPPPTSDESPPAPQQIVEAMLFIGGPPLTAEKVCSAVRGLTSEAFRELIDELTVRYRRQNRPYAVRPQGDGFVLGIRSEFRHLKERLLGSPREARLTQPALDVLSLVAYRQPITKPELDALRGADSASFVRQLVRLGLIASGKRPAAVEGEKAEVAYATTPRFLELFHLTSLDDLPRLGDSKPG